MTTSKYRVELTKAISSANLFSGNSVRSHYFKVLFDAHPSSQHPIIIMRDFRLSDVKALIEYMHKGVVQITRGDLREFQKTSQALKIKLTGIQTLTFLQGENDDE